MNKISKGDFGSSWLSEMVGMKQGFNIIERKGGLSSGSDASNAYINYDDEVKLATTQGEQDAPDYVRLGHELAHAYSEVKGFADETEWVPGVVKDEWYAGTVENVLRSDQGDPLRETYTSYPWYLPFDNEKTRLISKTPTITVKLDGTVVYIYQAINDPRKPKN